MTVIPYGDEELTLNLPTGCDQTELNIIDPPPLYDFKMELLRLLESSPFSLNSNNIIALICDTNPASVQVLNTLLNSLSYITELERVRVFIIAQNGIPSDMPKLDSKYPIIYHDPRESAKQMIGYTSYGTPVEINADFLESTIRITLGSFLPDPFWSMTGSLTHILPGLTSHRTNITNTRLALSQKPMPMNFKAKRFIDASDAVELANIDMFLTVQTKTRNQIVGLSAAYSINDLLMLFKNASRIFFQRVNRYHDLIIVGAGGSPLDSTLFDAIPALYSALSITRRNGTIVLVSKCASGLGPISFATLVNKLDQLEQSQIPCQIGSEKIHFLLEVLKYNRLLIYSDCLDARLNDIHPNIEVLSNLESCIDAAYSSMTSASRILVIQDGHRIIPMTATI